MNGSDTGVFTYDDRFPPFCIRESNFNDLGMTDVSNFVETHMMNSSVYRHENANSLCYNGMTIGEVGLSYIRQMPLEELEIYCNDASIHTKATPLNLPKASPMEILDAGMLERSSEIATLEKTISEKLFRYMGVDVSLYRALYTDILIGGLIAIPTQKPISKQSTTRLIKQFLGSSGLKSDGYTRMLKLVIDSLALQDVKHD